MSIDWWTLGLQAVNFLVLIWLLQRFLYRPVLAIIDRRRDEAEAVRLKREEAERLVRQAQQREGEQRQALAAEAAGLRREAEALASRRGEVVLAEARAQAERLLVQARDTIEAERVEASAALMGHAAGVATALATRLLDEVGPGLGPDPFLHLLVERLSALTVEEKAVLLRHGEEDVVSLRVEVSPPLAVERQPDWRRRLLQALGQAVELDFVHVPALIAGARVIFPAADLGVSWADALGAAQAGMVSDGKLER
jgi:F-type H+-transporting ATPase subunit b